MNDDEAFEHYDNPAAREPATGTPRRRSSKPLTQHVPVRFPVESINRVKALADEEGLTVSTWIRRAVDQALQSHDAQEISTAEAHAAVVHLQQDLTELTATLQRQVAPTVDLMAALKATLAAAQKAQAREARKAS
mgnify:CR=1 FL=1